MSATTIQQISFAGQWWWRISYTGEDAVLMLS
jgi:hypothetical protein